MAVTGNKRQHASNIAFANVTNGARKKKCVDIHSLLTVTKPLSARALSHAGKKQMDRKSLGSDLIQSRGGSSGDVAGGGRAQSRPYKNGIGRGGNSDKVSMFKATPKSQERSNASNRGCGSDEEQGVVDLAEDDDELYDDVDDDVDDDVEDDMDDVVVADEEVEDEEHGLAELDDLRCEVCGRDDGDDEMLLCDGRGCNRGYHLWCLRPILVAVPLGQWLCPDCRRPAKIREFPLVQKSILDFFRIQRTPGLTPEKSPAAGGANQGDGGRQSSRVTTEHSEHSKSVSTGGVPGTGGPDGAGRSRCSGSTGADGSRVGARTGIVANATSDVCSNTGTGGGNTSSVGGNIGRTGGQCRTKGSSTTSRRTVIGQGSDSGIGDCGLTTNTGEGSFESSNHNGSTRKSVQSSSSSRSSRSSSSRGRKRQTRIKLSRKLFPHRPVTDPKRRLEQLRSLATALTAIGARFVDGLDYPFKAVPRGMNEPGREVGGMQALSRENVGVLARCEEMWRRGEPPPLIVKHDPCQGFVVEADAPIADRTIVTEYGGVVDTMARRRHDPCDAMMGLLFTGRDKTDLVICPDEAANFARFISGINNHSKEGRRKINLRCVRFSVNGEARALLIANRRIAKGERLYYDYNRLVHEYPTIHFE